MGSMKSTKDQTLFIGVLNLAKGKKKASDLKQQENKKQENPGSSDGISNPRIDKEKKN